MNTKTVNIKISGTTYPFSAYVQKLGRITIPEEIRNLLDIKKGDKVGGFLWKISKITDKGVKGE